MPRIMFVDNNGRPIMRDINVIELFDHKGTYMCDHDIKRAKEKEANEQQQASDPSHGA